MAWRVAPRLVRRLCLSALSIAFLLSVYRYSEKSWAGIWAFLGRIVGIVSTIYAIVFVFYDRGSRDVYNTFLVSLAVISVVYFLITSPLPWFLSSLALSFLWAAAFSV